MNLTDPSDNSSCGPEPPAPVEGLHFKVLLGTLYSAVLLTAVCGNTLVVYVVVTRKDMQTVTNIFITNLAVSDFLVSVTSLWLTPMYVYIGQWIFGNPLCYLFPLFQGIAVFNSTLTLMAIAVDRYIVILYPFKPRISRNVCATVIISIWLLSVMLVFPYSLHMKINIYCNKIICKETWPESVPSLRPIYGTVVLTLQFGIPLVVICICYARIWWHITRRETTAVSSNKDADVNRRRRLMKMLSAMVVIFTLCWLPTNMLNITRDAGVMDKSVYFKRHFSLFFLLGHVICMSATCWNPILYSWMNENFRREFKAVLPCFQGNRRRAYREILGN